MLFAGARQRHTKPARLCSGAYGTEQRSAPHWHETPGRFAPYGSRGYILTNLLTKAGEQRLMVNLHGYHPRAWQHLTALSDRRGAGRGVQPVGGGSPRPHNVTLAYTRMLLGVDYTPAFAM
jgi:hypothetical protein